LHDVGGVTTRAEAADTFDTFYPEPCPRAPVFQSIQFSDMSLVDYVSVLVPRIIGCQMYILAMTLKIRMDLK